MTNDERTLFESAQKNAFPLTGAKQDYDPLLELIGNSNFVLLGSATQGTAEFYKARAEISKRLIIEKGFTAIGIEAGWPFVHRTNQYIQKINSHDKSVKEALSDLNQFPHWLWQNKQFAGFIEFLKTFNSSLPQRAAPVHLFGFDMYNPAIAPTSSLTSEELIFYQELNAHIYPFAERYYRTFNDETEQVLWNLRTDAMTATIRLIEQHLASQVGRTKIIIWAHNMHVGNSLATNQGVHDQITLGQRMRELHFDDVVLVGFLTNSGTALATADWKKEPQKITLPPAQSGSYEHLFTQLNIPQFLLNVRTNPLADFSYNKIERSISALYKPEQESHYYLIAELDDQFDSVLYFDKTTAIEPFPKPTKEEKEPNTFLLGF